jgi:hypothetical protein
MISIEPRRAGGTFHLPIGSIVSAGLLWIGCNGLVAALKTPLAALLVYFINSLLWRKHVEVSPIAIPSFSWGVQATYALTALFVVALGLGLGFWLDRKERA